ncbi:lysophospholipase catalytic domain-containing protein [Melampsora americana]|nr:lysophospholipase catalytic domain-containing protein [Melampsora americana]
MKDWYRWVFYLLYHLDGIYSQPQLPEKAIRNSPSGSYAPKKVICPEGLHVRQASIEGPLASQEEEYVASRAAQSIPIWKEYLSRVRLHDFSIEEFLKKAEAEGGKAGDTLPNIGLAFSGGGARATLVGASVLNALDSRNEEASMARTGGVLQLSNYVAGLSGGSWLIGSWAVSNFPTLPELNRTVWRLTNDNQPMDLATISRYPHFIRVAKEKKKAGFLASLVDVWSAMISAHFINDDDEGNAVLFSSIRNVSHYKNHTAPFPIVVATSRYKGTGDIVIGSPTYEFTPEEFGLWHPSLNAFIPMDYLGTSMQSGVPSHDDYCVKGYDNAGFVLGTSSNILSQSANSLPAGTFFRIFSRFWRLCVSGIYDEALIPNPFVGLGVGFGPGSGYPDRDSDKLCLADGSFAGEDIPLWPLVIPSRKMDVVFAVDARSDGIESGSLTGIGYSNGTSIYNAYLKSQLPEYTAYPFPKVPDPALEFTEKGLHQRPSFFGCNETSPLIIYFPNYYAASPTDVATVKATYTGKEIDGFFANGFAITTQATGASFEDGFSSGPELQDILNRAGPIDKTDWAACLACALIDRQRIRNGQPRTVQCETCFWKFCA